MDNNRGLFADATQVFAENPAFLAVITAYKKMIGLLLGWLNSHSLTRLQECGGGTVLCRGNEQSRVSIENDCLVSEFACLQDSP
jgi:hypothetical protein